MKTVTQKPIGILGGCFDPVHIGHCAIAQLAYEYFSLSRVYFIPAFIPPHKKQSIGTPAKHRVAMLKLAIKGNRAFALWKGEIRRKGISYSIDTLNMIKEEFRGASVYYIIGSDNIMEMLTWREYEKIIQSVTLCIVHRPGYPLTTPPELEKAKILNFHSPEWGISSTMIRSLAANNISCRYLVPPGVESYIRRHRLYQEKKEKQ